LERGNYTLLWSRRGDKEPVARDNKGKKGKSKEKISSQENHRRIQKGEKRMGRDEKNPCYENDETAMKRKTGGPKGDKSWGQRRSQTEKKGGTKPYREWEGNFRPRGVG